MKKVGILYICTGKYVVFWKDFFQTFEDNFLPDAEKHYFVFTDAEILFGEDYCNRIHKNNQESMPWPLPTLLKYKSFLSIKDELKKMDFLYQTNANIVCKEKVFLDEMFSVNENEGLFFTIHSGFADKKGCYAPYDRNEKSNAFVPYSKGKKYVFGAMNGGRADLYIQFMETLENRIEDDLKRNIIARFHDESHVNHYVSTHKNYRILSSEYCHPGKDLLPDVPIKITGLNKENYFDVKDLKGIHTEKHKTWKNSPIINKLRCIYYQIRTEYLYLRDKIKYK